MGRVKEFYTCKECDTFLLNDRLNIKLKPYSNEECFGYICPICKTVNEIKKNT